MPVTRDPDPPALTVLRTNRPAMFDRAIFDEAIFDPGDLDALSVDRTPDPPAL